MIGLSVSHCVTDIIHGLVHEVDVEKVISGLNVANERQLDVVIAGYRTDYWAEHPEEAERIVRLWWRQGRIIQPRRNTGLSPSLENGHWVAIESEIRWLRFNGVKWSEDH